MKTRVYVWVLLLILAGLTVTYLIDWGEKDVVLQKIFYLCGPITALVTGVMTIKIMGWRGKRSRVVESVMAALGLWLMAELVTLYMVWVNVDSYPSAADLLFILGYVMFSVAIILEAKLFGLKIKQLDKKILVPLCITLITVVGVVCYIAFKGYKADESLLSNLTTISWSMGDLVMGGLGLMLLAMVWEYRRGTVKREWMWFITATFINLIADTIYNLYPNAISEGSILTIILDVMWTGGYLLMAGYFLEMRQEVLRMQRKTM